MTETSTVKIIAEFSIGNVAYDTQVGMVYMLTKCCNASGKGSSVDDNDFQIVCRSCYTQVDSIFALGESVEESRAIKVAKGWIGNLI
jgi:hypothetical protein